MRVWVYMLSTLAMLTALPALAEAVKPMPAVHTISTDDAEKSPSAWPRELENINFDAIAPAAGPGHSMIPRLSYGHEDGDALLRDLQSFTENR